MPQSTLSTTASTPVPQNRLRISIVFTNIDTTDNIFLATRQVGTITASNAGIRLRPGDTIAFNNLVDGLESVTDRWQAIASAGTPILLWFETQSVER